MSEQDIFSDQTQKLLLDAWHKAARANNTPVADISEAALSAVNDAEAAVAEATTAVSMAEAVQERSP